MSDLRKRSYALVTAVIIIMAATCPILLSDDEEDSEAIPSWVAFVVGMGAGYLLYEALHPPSTDTMAGQVDELKKALAESEKGKVYLSLKNVNDLAGSVLPADAQMLFFTQNYWDQAMEYQVYESWTKDAMGQFEKFCKELLAGTGFLASESNYLYTWSDALDYAFNDTLAQSKYWTGEGDLGYTQALSTSFIWNGKELTASNGSESGVLSVDFTQQITTTKSTLVYIDILNETDNYDPEQSGTMYLYGTSGSVSIQNMDTGANYTLKPGKNDMTSLPAGVYKLPGGASFAGPMVSVIGESSAPVQGSMVIMSGSQIYFVTPLNETTYKIESDTGGTWSSDYLDIRISDGVKADDVHILYEGGFDLVGKYDSLVQEFNQLAANTYTTGEATWKVFDTVEQSSPYIHPSSIPINIEGQTLSMVEKYYITINSMAQIKEYYEQNAGDLKELDITFTKDSLDLFCYGDLYYNGKLCVENVVFTPYISGSDQHLELGMNSWQGSGFMSVWAQVDNYYAWNGTVSASSPMSPLDKNYELDIEKIVSHGKEVESIDLKRSVIVASSQQSGDPDPEPVPMPSMFDASILWMIIIIEAGIILIMAGRITGIQLLTTIGLVVLLVGIVVPQAVSSLLLGTFTWADLKPFGWI